MLNKLFTISLLILLIVLAGCATKVTTAPEPQPSKVNKEAAQERAAEAEQAQMNPKIAALLVNKNIIPNIIYEYSRPPDDPQIYTYHIKGDKAKVDLPRSNYIPKGEARLDVAYLDIVARKAVAYCEEKGVCEDRNKAYDVDFDRYYFRNPYDWLADVSGDAEIVGTEQISTRDVTHIKYNEDSTTTELWIDEFYKVPLEVKVTSNLGTARYIYHLISINSVKDSELAHVQLENY